MYKVYRGGGGRPQRIEEPSSPPPPPPMPPHAASGTQGPPGAEALAGPVQQMLESLLGRVTGELETEDLILLLILYLLYRESGDTEMILIMGAMLLL